MIKSCINKRKSREITSMQKRKNSSLGGHEFTLAIKSLYEEKGNDGYLWSEAQTINVVCYEDNYFPKRKFKLFNSLYHSVYLVFSTCLFYCQYVCRALPVENVCNETATSDNGSYRTYGNNKTWRVTSIIAENKPHADHETHLHTMKVATILIPSFHGLC